jgi:hypothetical protein
MLKTGHKKTNKTKISTHDKKCAGCGQLASFWAKFKDCFGEIKINLCEDCTTRGYIILIMCKKLTWITKQQQAKSDFPIGIIGKSDLTTVD